MKKRIFSMAPICLLICAVILADGFFGLRAAFKTLPDRTGEVVYPTAPDDTVPSPEEDQTETLTFDLPDEYPWDLIEYDTEIYPLENGGGTDEMSALIACFMDGEKLWIKDDRYVDADNGNLTPDSVSYDTFKTCRTGGLRFFMGFPVVSTETPDALFSLSAAFDGDGRPVAFCLEAQKDGGAYVDPFYSDRFAAQVSVFKAEREDMRAQFKDVIDRVGSGAQLTYWDVFGYRRGARAGEDGKWYLETLSDPICWFFLSYCNYYNCLSFFCGVEGEAYTYPEYDEALADLLIYGDMTFESEIRYGTVVFNYGENMARLKYDFALGCLTGMSIKLVNDASETG